MFPEGASIVLGRLETFYTFPPHLPPWAGAANLVASDL